MTAIQNKRQAANVVVTVLFGLLATTAVTGRFISRKTQRVELLVSDWLMLLALIFALGAVVSNLIAVVDGGLGLHQTGLSLDQVLIYGKSITALQVLWAAAEGAVKSSMCLLYIQLFPQRWFHITAYAVLAISNAFAVAVILGTIFICQPVAFSWDPTVGGSCGHRVEMWVAIGVLNILTDLMVVALPIPVIKDLSMRTAKKIGLIVIFSLGAFVCIVSGVRLKFLLAVDFNGDAAFEIAEANIWSILEPTLAITFGCMPTLRPLFRSRPLFEGNRKDTTKQGSYVVRSETRRRQDFTQLSENDLMLTSVSVSAPQQKPSRVSKILSPRVSRQYHQENQSQSGSDWGDKIEVTRQVDISYESKAECADRTMYK